MERKNMYNGARLQGIPCTVIHNELRVSSLGYQDLEKVHSALETGCIPHSFSWFFLQKRVKMLYHMFSALA